jgi:hypothetical protein
LPLPLSLFLFLEQFDGDDGGDDDNTTMEI